MLKISKIYEDDFSKVYPLLSIHDNSIKKEEWRKLFKKYWGNEENYFGFMLLDQKRVVGLICTIFSKREIRGKIYNFCNTSSLYVLPEYRASSFFLLRAACKLKEYIVTSFTPIDEIVPLLEKLKFKTLDTNSILILPHISRKIFFHKGKLILVEKQILNLLPPKLRKIYEDHQVNNFTHYILIYQDDMCYFVLKNIYKMKMPFASIYYISNVNLFRQNTSYIVQLIIYKLKVLGVIIDEHYAIGLDLKAKYIIRRRSYYRSTSDEIKRDDIDRLYSELVILPLNH